MSIVCYFQLQSRFEVKNKFAFHFQAFVVRLTELQTIERDSIPRMLEISISSRLQFLAARIRELAVALELGQGFRMKLSLITRGARA